MFVATKYWCYRIITAICGVPTAILCGIYFACLSFDYIWCIMPCLRAYVIELQCLGKLFSLCVRTYFDPFFESVGRIFGGTRISYAFERRQQTIFGMRIFVSSRKCYSLSCLDILKVQRRELKTRHLT